jgi:hypothetical protein
VRVYVGVGGSTVPLFNVSGRIRRAGTTDWREALPSDNSITVFPGDPLTRREELTSTLNFSLPGDWRAGAYDFEVWIDSERRVPECPLASCEENNVGSGELRFLPARPLDVVLVRAMAGGFVTRPARRGAAGALDPAIFSAQ